MTNPTVPELFQGESKDIATYSALLEASHIGLRRTGAVAETIARGGHSSAAVTLTTGETNFTSINLAAGQIVTTITFFAIGAAVTPTHAVAGLFDSATAPTVLATSADGLTAAWGANAEHAFTLTTPYTVKTDGIFNIALTVSAGTPPTLAGATGTAALNLLAPTIAFHDATAVTAALSSPAVKSAGASVLYAYVS